MQDKCKFPFVKSKSRVSLPLIKVGAGQVSLLKDWDRANFSTQNGWGRASFPVIRA